MGSTTLETYVYYCTRNRSLGNETYIQKLNLKDLKKICKFPSNDLFYCNSQALPKNQLNEFSYKICYFYATVDTFVPSLH